MNLCAKQNRSTDTESKHDYQRGNKGRDNLGICDWYIHTTIYKIGKQQGPIMQHRELNSLSYLLSILSFVIITYNRNESEKNMYVCIYINIYEHVYSWITLLTIETNTV